MSHGLTQRRNGIVEFAFRGQLPWHTLGIRIDDNTSVADALVKSNCSWLVQDRPLWVRSMPNEPAFQIEDKKAICRVDNGAYLGTVGKGYVAVQNHEVASLAEVICGEGNAIVEAIGSLWGGKQFFMCLKVKDPLTFKLGDFSDTVEQYIVVMNAHDGSKCQWTFDTKTRTVCNNTLSMAMAGSKNVSLRFRHTKNIKHRIEDAKRIIEANRRKAEQFVAVAETMIDTTIGKDDYMKLLDNVFGDEGAEDITTVTRNKIERQKGLATENLIKEREVTYRGSYELTLWEAFNSITYYTSHQHEAKNKDDGKRFSSILGGTAYGIQEKAFAASLDLVKA